MAAASKTKKVFDNRYEILSIVGRGAGSVVYHARHIDSPLSEVALKVLVDHNAETKNSERLRKEALAMVSARHRYVLRLDDFHTLGSICYLCLEYAPESDLRRYSQKVGGRLGVAQAEIFLSQAAEGLSFVHKAGIVHRDIKPDNILVISDQEIRICDFGIALLPGETSSLQELQAGVGTMSYMPPEVLEGRDFDVRADIYALGLSFYEMMTGEHPFENVPLIEQLDARRDDRIRPLKDLVAGCPEYLSDIIAQTLRYNIEDRFQTARELVDALGAKSLLPAAAARSSKIKYFPGKERKVPISDESNTSELPTEIVPLEARSTGTEDAVPATISSVPTLVAAEPPAVAAPLEVTAPEIEIKEESPTTPSETDSIESQIEAQETGESIAEPTPAPSSERVEVRDDQVVESPFLRTSSGTSTYIEPFREISGATHYEDAQPSADDDQGATQEIPREQVEQILAGEAATATEAIAANATTENAIASAPTEQIDRTALLPLEQQPTVATEGTSTSRPTVRIKPLAGATPYSGNSRRAMIIPVIVIAASLFVVVMKFLAATRGPQTQPVVPTKSAQNEAITAAPAGLPKDQGKPLAFPVLTPGVYHGTVVRFVDKLSFPLAILSFEDRRYAAVIVGLPGWTPQVIDLEKFQNLSADAPERGVLRVASNGIILEFRGAIDDGKISGTFTNKISGEVGTWSVSRIR